MRTPSPLCGSLLIALIAGSLGVQAQTPPVYRPPAATTAPSQSTTSSSGSPEQCTGGTAPASATLVGKGTGNAPAPSGGQASYSQTRLNLANYAVGGLLTIQITAGSGSAASFELFSGNVTFPPSGAPSAQPLTAQPLAAQPNVTAGTCATLTLNFSQAGTFILAATGAIGASTFQYAAYVQPSFAGVFSPSPAAQAAVARPATQTASPQASLPAASVAPGAPQPAVSTASSQPLPSSAQTGSTQGSSLFAGVFQPPAAPQPSNASAVGPGGAAQTQPASAGSAPQGLTVSSSTLSGTLPTSTITSASAIATPSPASTTIANPSTPSPAPASPGASAAASPTSSAPAPSSAPGPAAPPAPFPGSGPNGFTPWPARITKVSIKNSPGVPDLGGHCIICGLVTGNFTAVEPNLVICLFPRGSSIGNKACTTICPPGHDCSDKPLSSGIIELTGGHPDVRVEVSDDDKKGNVQLLNADAELNAWKCTTSQPCPEMAKDGTQMSVSFDFGPVRCEGLTTVTGASAPATGNSKPAPPLPAGWPPPATSKNYVLSHVPTGAADEQQSSDTAFAMNPNAAPSGQDPANYNNPWQERFTLSKPTPTGGYVVQSIYMTVTGEKPQLFWEVFKVAPNTSYSEIDTWRANSMAWGCQGTMGVVATAAYYDGMTDAYVSSHFSKGGPDSPIDSPDSWYANDSIVSQLATSLYQPSNIVNRFWNIHYNYGQITPQ